ncbi:MAG: hypothetical protein RIF41_07570 [Polyangiaceae bacterium]
MSTSKPHTYPYAPIFVDDKGLGVEVERDGSGVTLTVEHDDHSGWSRPTTAERCVCLSWQEWDAIVAHVAADRAVEEDR